MRRREVVRFLGAALALPFLPRGAEAAIQLGKSLHEFRRASEDFKRTWEREVNLEHMDQGTEPSENSILDRAAERIRAAREAAALDSNPAETSTSVITPSITAIDPSLVQPRETKPLPETAPADQPASKHDWL